MVPLRGTREAYIQAVELSLREYRGAISLSGWTAQPLELFVHSPVS